MSKQLFMSVREQEVHADGENGVFEDTNAENLYALHNHFEGRQTATNLIHNMFEDFGRIFSPEASGLTTQINNEEGSI